MAVLKIQPISDDHYFFWMTGFHLGIFAPNIPDVKKASNIGHIPLIGLTLVCLSIYNLIYGLSAMFGLLPWIYEELIKHWKLLTFFEFLAVASLAADIIIRYDQFDLKERKWRFSLTALLGVLFALKFILGVIEIFMRGEMKV